VSFVNERKAVICDVLTKVTTKITVLYNVMRAVS